MIRLGGVVRPALVIVLIVAVLLAALWLLQRRLIYLPHPSAVPPVAEALPGGREVTLETSDGLALAAWLLPPAGPDRSTAVLVAPGNAGNRSHRAPLARALADRGFTVLLLDYRGYGGNPGRPSEAGLARDARAALDHLTATEGIPADQIVYFGESLGAAVVTELAVEHPPAGLVLRSPFTDLAAAAAVHYPFLPVRAMLWDRFPVTDHIRQVQAPTAVVYGDADSVVPPAQSRRVADLATDLVRVTVVPGADHNDPALTDGPAVVAAVIAVAARA